MVLLPLSTGCYHRCPSPFPSPSISRCFFIHSSSPAIELHSCFFFTTLRFFCTHRSNLLLLTSSVSFQAWDWLWYPTLCSQRRNRDAHQAEISFSIYALSGFEPRTLQSDGRERKHSTTGHPKTYMHDTYNIILVGLLH